ncbi:MAG: hypothetical protein IPP44_28700 [Ideonella sp.]|nr:hypothetical protein [Ideonella sp.]
MNNPLTGVLTFTSLMRKKTPNGTQDAEDLDLVIRETKRCAAIIKRLLDFAREKVPGQGPFRSEPGGRRHRDLRRTPGLAAKHRDLPPPRPGLAAGLGAMRT